jgi:DnaJ-domain-containing protein 1
MEFKRKLDQSQAAVNKAMDYLAEFVIVYVEQHPDLAVQAGMILEGLEVAEHAIEELNKQV